MRKIGKPFSDHIWQAATILFVLILFLVIVFITFPSSVESQYSNMPMQINTTPTITPLPEEWLQNAHQTDGIALGGTILVLIILIGTISALFRKNNNKK
jgi:cbb3-type cytochrome oxidase subunit 3